VADLDAYTDVIGPDARAVWPLLAKAVKNIRGALVGGTALAMHLRHRVSYDLDYMTYKSFSGEHLYRRLCSTAATAVAGTAVKDQMNAVIEGVAVDVFMAPYRGDNPGHVKPQGLTSAMGLHEGKEKPCGEGAAPYMGT